MENGRETVQDKNRATGGGFLRKFSIITERSQFEHCKSPEDFALDPNGGVAGIHSIEDLVEIVGFNGKWNIFILGMILLYSTTSPMHIITYQFLGATPTYWCHIDELVDANWTQNQILELAIPLSNGVKGSHEGCKYHNYNYTLAAELGFEKARESLDLINIKGGEPYLKCLSRDYNTSQYTSTVVIEWDLVCENRAKYSTTQSASQIGILLGALTASLLLERFGRRPIILIGIVIRIIAAFSTAIVTNFTLYVLLRVLIASSSFAVSSGNFLIAMEISSPKQRTLFGVFSGVFWGIGYIICPGIAYFIRSWRWLQAAYSCFCLLPLVYFVFLPESPRWLIFRGRYEEAMEIFTSAAKMNNNPLPPSNALLTSMKALTPQKKEHTNESLFQILLGKVKYYFTLFRKAEYRWKIFVCFYCWFAVSLVYYGVSLNSGNLSTDPYLYIFLGGLIEIVSSLIMWMMLAVIGRKVSLSIYYLTTSISITIIACLQYVKYEDSSGLFMFLSLAGKFGMTNAFTVVYIFTGELFPTDIRPVAMGQSSMTARGGSISSPYINDLLGEYITWMPSAIYAIVAFIAGLIVLVLPETAGTNLTEHKLQSTKEADQEKGETLAKQVYTNQAYEES